jgi:hypothetical protein
MAVLSATGMAVLIVKLGSLNLWEGLVTGEYWLCGRGLIGPAWQAVVTGWYIALSGADASTSKYRY